jgi:hypothetical protein
MMGYGVNMLVCDLCGFVSWKLDEVERFEVEVAIADGVDRRGAMAMAICSL